VLVLKKNVHEPGHFQYTIHYEGKSFSCPQTQKGFASYYMHFSSFKICSQFFLVSASLHDISLLILLPKSYFKISTIQPNFLCSSSFLLTSHVESAHAQYWANVELLFLDREAHYEEIPEISKEFLVIIDFVLQTNQIVKLSHM